VPLDVEPQVSDGVLVRLASMVAAIMHLPALMVFRSAGFPGMAPAVVVCFWFGYLDLLAFWFSAVLACRALRKWLKKEKWHILSLAKD
jgi:hypothetical protein